ncbi:hypothetical protein PENTCL1PPCAC_29206, partial [Pristionchus entomophagus]
PKWARGAKVFRCQCPSSTVSWPVTYKVVVAPVQMHTIRSSGRSLDRLCRRGSHDDVKKRTPSPLCCLGIMHIRTATYWIAYAEMMWITSQFAFWMAQLVVGCTHWALLTVGFISVIVQSFLVHRLCRGIKYFILRCIRIYQLGLLIRMISCVLFTAIAVYFLQFEKSGKQEEGK